MLLRILQIGPKEIQIEVERAISAYICSLLANFKSYEMCMRYKKVSYFNQISMLHEKCLVISKSNVVDVNVANIVLKNVFEATLC